MTTPIRVRLGFREYNIHVHSMGRRGHWFELFDGAVPDMPMTVYDVAKRESLDWQAVTVKCSEAIRLRDLN